MTLPIDQWVGQLAGLSLVLWAVSASLVPPVGGLAQDRTVCLPGWREVELCFDAGGRHCIVPYGPTFVNLIEFDDHLAGARPPGSATTLMIYSPVFSWSSNWFLSRRGAPSRAGNPVETAIDGVRDVGSARRGALATEHVPPTEDIFRIAQTVVLQGGAGRDCPAVACRLLGREQLHGTGVDAGIYLGSTHGLADSVWRAMP
nr:hypothetical protein GCM10017611_79100 [Rhodococcus wratislaviensis]